MSERWYWRDIKANLGIQLKTLGCYLINGWKQHPWGEWRNDIRACTCCGNYDLRVQAFTVVDNTIVRVRRSDHE